MLFTSLLFGLDIPDFGSTSIILSLITLTFLEIVLGVDNIIFISIASSKLKPEDRKKATNIGLLLAMFLRIALLFGVSILISMRQPFYNINTSWLSVGISGQSIILIAGGIFLLYKAVTEIHHKLEGIDTDHSRDHGKTQTLSSAIIQISIINIVFSIDSILTAVGMTNGLYGALIVMIIAVVFSVIIMMSFAVPVGNFVNRNPTIQMLGLSFLILIGFMLIVEGGHLANLKIFDSEIGTVPKGYLYFAIAFSLLVEMLNMRLRKQEDPVKLHSFAKEADQKGLLDDNPLDDK